MTVHFSCIHAELFYNGLGRIIMCLSLSILKRVIETVPPDFSPRLPYLSKCKKILKNKEDRIKIYYRYFYIRI